MSSGPLRGRERAWYTLNVHASTLSIKFAVKVHGYHYHEVAKYTKKMGIRSSLERNNLKARQAKFRLFNERNYF